MTKPSEEFTFARFREIILEGIGNLPLPKEPAGLYDPIRYALASGGKLLRPTLVLATAQACGATPSSVLNQALAVEIFHNFTLLHDDVMDRAEVRRGRPTVHCRWNDNTAILSGDAMLTFATMVLAHGASYRLPAALDLFNRTAMEVYEGQQLDMDFESRDDVTTEDYMEMIRLKTSVLLGCACRLGALMAGASDEVQQSLYDYGVSLGLAFQLRDDWLDTFGDVKEFGKTIGGDILNGKKTWLLIEALADNKARLKIEPWLSRVDKPDEKIAVVTAAYKDAGLDLRCRSLAEEYSRRAVAALPDLGAEARRFLTTIALDASSRKR